MVIENLYLFKYNVYELLILNFQYLHTVTRNYRIPADLLIDRKGWGSPIINPDNSSPTYGMQRQGVVVDNPNYIQQLVPPSDLPPPEEQRQMPETSLVVSQPSPSMSTESSAVEPFTPTNIIE